MPEVEVTANIEVWCGECGKGLCRLSKGIKGGVEVEPCPDCLEEAKKEAYDEGYDEGYEKGQADA